MPVMMSMPRVFMPSTTKLRRSSSTWCRLFELIRPLRVRIVVGIPAALKKEPYSMAILDPPMITHLLGS